MLHQLLWLLLLAVVTLFYTDAQLQTELADKQDKQQQQQQQRVVARHNCEMPTEDDEWELFKETYSREYPNKEEEARRREIWKANVYAIAEHNRKYEQGSTTYTQVANNFTDWGLVGTCHAFSALAALESQLLIFDCVNFDLSEQQIVDCSYGYNDPIPTTNDVVHRNDGVNGGMPYVSFAFLTGSGSVSEDNYLYTQTNGSCKCDQQDVIVRIGGCKRTPYGDETALKAAVATYGPISVAIDVQQSLKFYQDGVYNDNSCTDFNYTHAVLVVGYGEIVGGMDYWSIKNSWGVGWGDLGYFKLARNQNNKCAVACECVFPCGVELVCPPELEKKFNCKSRHRGGRSCDQL